MLTALKIAQLCLHLW